MLAEADTGAVEGLEKWCLYVLTGISTELKKVDKLSNLHFLNSKILYPALEYCKVRGIINETESKILKRTTSQGTAKANDLKEVLLGLKSAQITYQIGKLVDRGLLQPIEMGSRIYTAAFSKSDLMRGVIHALRKEGFIPDF